MPYMPLIDAARAAGLDPAELRMAVVLGQVPGKRRSRSDEWQVQDEGARRWKVQRDADKIAEQLADAKEVP